MTVKELIEDLRKRDQTATVLYINYNEYGEDVYNDIYTITQTKFIKDQEVRLQ